MILVRVESDPLFSNKTNTFFEYYFFDKLSEAVDFLSNYDLSKMINYNIYSCHSISF